MADKQVKALSKRRDTESLDDTSYKDYLIDPDRPSVLTTVASYIIVTEFCERLAYYGFAGSLVLFFETKLNLSNEDSVNQFYLWNG